MKRTLWKWAQMVGGLTIKWAFNPIISSLCPKEMSRRFLDMSPSLSLCLAVSLLLFVYLSLYIYVHTKIRVSRVNRVDKSCFLIRNVFFLCKINLNYKDVNFIWWYISYYIIMTALSTCLDTYPNNTTAFWPVCLVPSAYWLYLIFHCVAQ